MVIAPPWHETLSFVVPFSLWCFCRLCLPLAWGIQGARTTHTSRKKRMLYEHDRDKRVKKKKRLPPSPWSRSLIAVFGFRWFVSYFFLFFFVLCYGYLHAAEGRCVHVSRWAYRYCVCESVCVCFFFWGWCVKVIDGILRQPFVHFLPTYTWPGQSGSQIHHRRVTVVDWDTDTDTDTKQNRNRYRFEIYIKSGVYHMVVPVVCCSPCFVSFVARWPDIISVMFRVVVGFLFGRLSVVSWPQ